MRSHPVLACLACLAAVLPSLGQSALAAPQTKAPPAGKTPGKPAGTPAGKPAGTPAGKPAARPLPPPHKRPPPTPVGLTLVMKSAAQGGFYDDPIAFSADGARIAAVRTDGESFAQAEIFELAQAADPVKPARTIDLKPFSLNTVTMAFLKDGQSLFIKARPPSASEVPSPARAQIYAADGKVVRSYGPATDIALTEAGGVEVVVVYDEKPSKSGGVTYHIVVTRADNGKPVQKRLLAADKEGVVKSHELRVGFFSQNYLTIYGKQKGAFDKAKDMRLPDRHARYDVLAGKIAASREITDLTESQRLLNVRRGYPNQSAFVRVTDDLHQLELVTAEDHAIAVALAEDFVKYDPGSLKQQLSGDEKLLLFSLTIDPVNVLAVKKKVADIDYIDFYSADTATGQAARLARLPAGKRPFAWRASTGLWAVLRKHKGFSRGGPELEVYTAAK